MVAMMAYGLPSKMLITSPFFNVHDWNGEIQLTFFGLATCLLTSTPASPKAFFTSGEGSSRRRIAAPSPSAARSSSRVDRPSIGQIVGFNSSSIDEIRRPS